MLLLFLCHIPLERVHVQGHSRSRKLLFVAALWNRAGHYIFMLWFLYSIFYLLFSSHNLSGRRLDAYHSSTHGVALV